LGLLAVLGLVVNDFAGTGCDSASWHGDSTLPVGPAASRHARATHSSPGSTSHPSPPSELDHRPHGLDHLE